MKLAGSHHDGDSYEASFYMITSYINVHIYEHDMYTCTLNVHVKYKWHVISYTTLNVGFNHLKMSASLFLQATKNSRQKIQKWT